MFKNKELFSLEKRIKWLEEKNKYRLLKDTGIHEGQPDILAYIYMHKDCTQYDIARYLGLSRASVNVSLKRMQKSGYITIRANEESKRSSCVSITPLGTKVLVRSDMVLNEYITKKYDGISNEEINTYITVMKKIEKNLIKTYKEQHKEDK